MSEILLNILGWQELISGKTWHLCLRSERILEFEETFLIEKSTGMRYLIQFVGIGQLFVEYETVNIWS